MSNEKKPIMGIGMLGDPNILIRRKFRYTLSAEFPNHKIEENFVKINCRPNLETAEAEINYLSAKTWIPGSALNHLTTTYYDVTDTDPLLKTLFDYFRSVFDFNTNEQKTQEPGEGLLTMYDGAGNVLDKWTLNDFRMSAVNFGELSYSSSDTMDLEVDWTYSSAIYENVSSKNLWPSSTSVKSADRKVEPLLGGQTEAQPNL